MKTGVFWVIDDELIAIPFDKFKYVEGIAKSGETYNHEKLWELVKSKNCNKPYNYYPRGRVVNGAKGKTIIYMNSNIKSEFIHAISSAFEIEKELTIKYDYSQHYKCYLD